MDVRLYSQKDMTEYQIIDPQDSDVELYMSDNTQPQIRYEGELSVDGALATPTTFKLAQNYPNPFNPTTVIEYNVESSGLVTLNVYDIMGRLVKTLVDNQFKVAGNQSGYKAMWDGLDNKGHQVAAGVYIYRLQSGSMSQTNKMILLK